MQTFKVWVSSPAALCLSVNAETKEEAMEKFKKRDCSIDDVAHDDYDYDPDEIQLEDIEGQND